MSYGYEMYVFSAVVSIALCIHVLLVIGDSSTMDQAKEVKETTTVDLGTLLDAGDGAMVTLVAGNTRLVAHRAVLANGSPVFAAMFDQDMQEVGSEHITITDVEGSVLRQLLVYLYTRRVPQLASMAPALLAAANKYGVPGLKAQCEQQLAAQLSVENAAATAVLAVRYCCPSLMQAAVSFIKAHTHQVMATHGWADVVVKHPRTVVEFTSLIAKPPAEWRPTSGSQCRPHSGRGRTSATTAPLTGAHRSHTGTSGGHAVSVVRAPDAADEMAATRTHHQHHSDHTRTPSTAAVPTSPSRTTPLDDGAVASMRSLSEEEKGWKLLQAAQEGAVEQVRMLLEAGADVRAKDAYGDTALHRAATEGHVEVVRHLVEAGAEVEAKANSWLHGTPLHLAAEYGHAAVVQLLVASSADPNVRDGVKETPLHKAASQGHAEVASVLLNAGADREARDYSGRTPLVFARHYGHQRLIEMLS